MADKPRFNLTLQIEHQQPLTVEEATIIDDELVQATWNMMGLFIEELLKELGLDANETKERELIVELAYRVIFKEMTTLLDRPVTGQLAIAKPKSRKQRKQKG